jgi:NAD(P)-dependent dehydrogenase (short-subunit alcohol dehydrogenase family)
VDNAGTWFEEPFLAVSDEHWRAVPEINVVASARFVRLATPLLEQGDYPAVVNIASKNAFQGETSLALYNISKASLVAFTMTMALVPAAQFTRANEVAPATIGTSSGQRLSADPTESERLRQRIPLGRFGSASEVVQAVSPLCGESG